jgi:acyl-CoA synthetase (AMP-forming)/AMP-acid ligase II
MEDPDPELGVNLIAKENLTASCILPTIFHRILSIPKLKSYNLKSMRVIVSGADEITEEDKMQIAEAFGQVVTFYAASTETGPYANLRPKDWLRKKGNCIGYPFYGVELALLDDGGNEVAWGEDGEICVRSPFQFDEYYKDPEATQAVRRGSFLSVGDMGRRDEEGYIYFVGRKRDIIKSGGINIYAPEIEEVLLRHSGIKDAAVIGVPDPEWIEAIKAIVVMKEGARVTEEEIISYCRENMASYKKPRSVEFISELPRNLNGKVIKEELRKKYGTHS